MSQRKILIVDDNALILKALSMKLTSKGYQVRTAQDGGEASAAVRREKPDLILLDVLFPADVGHGGGVPWDGFLIINWLRRLEEGKKTPIIVMSAAAAKDYENKAIAAGAVAFLQKPLDHDQLVAIIDETLGYNHDE